MTIPENKNKIKTILITDNFRTIKLVIESFLKGMYEILYAKTGKKTISTIDNYFSNINKSLSTKKNKETNEEKNGDILLIISHELSDTSPFDVVSQLRKKYDKYVLPIILNTSTNDKQVIIEGLKVGLNDYIIKPFPKELLLSKINKIELTISQENLIESNEISKIPFFYGVPQSQVAFILTTCSERLELKKGDTVCKQGDANFDMFILMEGECEVFFNNHKVSTVLPIETIGEISLIEQEKRSATVIAAKESKVILIKNKLFSDFLNEDRAISETICKNVIHTLINRLIKSNEVINTLKKC